ncbi:MAG TPA: penicillin-binding protein 2 [Actinomycetota bacterium]|nr:penicillin-binding protein 2 [Actinomycetota bacterium]
MTDGTLGKRLTALSAVVAFAMATLVVRLWFLQVLAAEEFQQAANSNRVRLIPLVAPRGRILDRNGEFLVTNKPTRTVFVDRRKVEDEDALLERLSDLLNAPVEELRENLHDPDYLPYQPVPVWEGAKPGAVLYLAEHRDEFPGVSYALTGTRFYTHGGLAPHLLGYLGEINPTELKDPSFSDHLPGEKVGRGGVEQYYEHFLHGDNGWLKMEVNSSGRTLGTLGREPPVPGHDLWLSLDWKVQQLAQDTLADAVGASRGSIYNEETGTYSQSSAGAVVVLDPNNGQVLAMASFPSYNPRVFLHGLTFREFRNLMRPSSNYPLNNRAIAGLYPPGSTFKPFVASAAIKAGHADVNGSYLCPPSFEWGGTVFHNWTTTNYGAIPLDRSLVISCDTVYYNFGLAFWQDLEARGPLFQQQMRKWGFGRETGIDIPGEQPGRVPDQRWKQQVHEELPAIFPEGTWLPGDDINMSIGQGDMLATPLQLAVAYGAIANGGALYRPQVGMKVSTPDGKVVKELEPRRVGRVPASPETLAFLRQALTGVVRGEGTAAGAFAGFPVDQYPVAGKTGTSQATLEGREVLHSWFAAIAPADDPKYVVAAVIEEGGHGSDVAAPVVRRVLEGLLGLEPSELNIVHTGQD